MLPGLLFVLLAGCSTSFSPYKAPEISLPVRYQDAAADAAQTIDGAPMDAASVKTDAATLDETLIEWWRYFGNNELEHLIDRGLSNNPDIHIAMNRVVQAKARADQAGARLNPSVSAPLVAALQFPGDVTVGTAPTGSSASRSSQPAFQGSIRADWRLDIWGEQKALAESANFQLRRAIYERENVQRNMAAGLAAGYVEFLSLNDRLRTALENENILNATLTAMEKRVKTGDATLSELEQQRALAYSVRAIIPALEQQRLDAIGSMAFLAGTVPGNVNLTDQGLDTLTVPRAVPGLPSSLLLRRPDVRMAEAQLQMADANVTVARAQLFPPVDLAGQVGYSSSSLSQLLRPNALFWNVVESMTVSIFDSGRKMNEQVYSQAVLAEMVESYVRTIHQAMKEVESALAAVRLAERRLKAQQETTEAARRAWNISAKVYAMGGIDFMSLLDTQRNYHRYLDDYQKTRMDYFRSYITLFQALGGGVKPIPQIAAGAADVTRKVPAKPIQTIEGIPMQEGSTSSLETFWQVELAGIYHHSTIGPAWRDLLTRYPKFMEGRVIRPRLSGRIDEKIDGQQSWHRLYVAKFTSPENAEEFCKVLKTDQKRCRVVSSQSDDTVVVSPPSRAAINSGTGITADTKDTQPTPYPRAWAATAYKATASGDAKQTVDWFQFPGKATPPSTTVPMTNERPPLRQEALDAVATNGDRVIYTVQLGAYAMADHAYHAAAVLQAKGTPVYVERIKDREKRTLYAVRVGNFKQLGDGQSLIRGLDPKERGKARMVRTNSDETAPATLTSAKPTP